MLTARANHASVLLADGRVALIGGVTGTSISGTATLSLEYYDPFTRTFNRGPDSALPELRVASVAAFPLADGRVAVVPRNVTLRPSILDIATGRTTTFAKTGTAIDAARLDDGRNLHPGRWPQVGGFRSGSGQSERHCGTVRIRRRRSADADGRRLLIGVQDPGDCTNIFADVFDPIGDTTTPIGQIRRHRRVHVATVRDRDCTLKRRSSDCWRFHELRRRKFVRDAGSSVMAYARNISSEVPHLPLELILNERGGLMTGSAVRFAALIAIGVVVGACSSAATPSQSPPPPPPLPVSAAPKAPTPNSSSMESVPPVTASLAPSAEPTRNPSAGYTDLPGWLVFEHFGQAPDGSTPTLDFNNRMIWMVHADGSGLHELSPKLPAPGKASPDISPDGKTVIFDSWAEPNSDLDGTDRRGAPTLISTDCNGYR